MKKLKLLHGLQDEHVQEEDEHVDNKPDLFHLPNHIILEILSRIPIKSLMHCRCVCHSWRCSLSDSHMTKYLSSQAPTCILLQNSSTINPNAPSLFLIDLDKASNPDDVVIKLPKNPNVPTRGVQVVGSCNGLLCMYDRLNCGRLYISNPVINESITLPTLGMEMDYQFVSGFGFCPRTEVYKVVVVPSPSEEGSDREVKVLSVGDSRVWRSIGRCGYHFAYQPYGVYLNGFLHWIGQTSDGSISICVFDIEAESFRELPLPVGFSPQKKCTFSIGILKGWLSLFVKSGIKINVWMMKDYGVEEESWTKELVIKGRSRSFSAAAHQVLKLTKKGQVLLLHKYRVYAYTPEVKRIAPVEIDGIPYMVEAFLHTPSFISLADALRA